MAGPRYEWTAWFKGETGGRVTKLHRFYLAGGTGSYLGAMTADCGVTMPAWAVMSTADDGKCKRCEKIAAKET